MTGSVIDTAVAWIEKNRRSIALSLIWAVMLGATIYGVARNVAIAGTFRLQMALDAGGVADALENETLAAVRGAIAWDFLLPLFYVPLLIIWIGFARHTFYVIPITKEWGRSLLFVVVVAGFADWIENTLHLWLLGRIDAFTPVGQWQAVWASSFAVVKWIGLALCIAYVLPATIWLIWLGFSRILPWQLGVQNLPRPGSVDDG